MQVSTKHSTTLANLISCSLFAACLAQTAGAAAQERLAQEQHTTASAPDGPRTLNVVVSASSAGQPIAGLAQGAFTVFEDGQPRPIEAFKPVSGEQAAAGVLLVVDAVNMPYTRLAYARQQVAGFLKSNGGHLELPTSLVLVSDTKTETTGFTIDGNGLSGILEDKVIGLRELTRSTGFYGAQERLDISLKALREVIDRAGQTPGHKIVIWVSPGWPLLSGPGVQLTPKEEQSIYAEVVGFTTVLQRADVTLYSVDPLGAGESVLRTFYYQNFLKGLRKPADAELGNLGLQVLAVNSGGLALDSSNDVSKLIQRAIDDTHAEYRLTLAPNSAPGESTSEFHSLDVRVAEPGRKARTLQGFYTQP